MTVLIVGEHDNNTLSPGTLSSVTAAQKLGDEVHLLVAGDDCRTAAEQAAVIDGVTRVLHGDNPANAHGIAENLAPLIAGLAEGYSHILAPASFFGKNVMPRVAAMLDVQPISDIMGVEDENTFQRPIYAGNAIATVQSADTLKILTVRSTAFDAAEQVSEAAQIVEIESPGDQGLTNFVSENLTQSDRPELTTAGRIISGGRGVGSAAAFQTLEKVADKIGAAIGASRAAVDAGFVPNDYQVGQTGKIVAPNLYVAVGISGAIQHLAGMKDSKMIVAINNDEDAPIFQVADYGLVMDWSEAMEELEAKL